MVNTDYQLSASYRLYDPALITNWSKAKSRPPKCWELGDDKTRLKQLNIKDISRLKREPLSSDHSRTTNQPYARESEFLNVCCSKFQNWFDWFGISAAMKKAVHIGFTDFHSLSITFPFSRGGELWVASQTCLFFLGPLLTTECSSVQAGWCVI